MVQVDLHPQFIAAHFWPRYNMYISQLEVCHVAHSFSWFQERKTASQIDPFYSVCVCVCARARARVCVRTRTCIHACQNKQKLSRKVMCLFPQQLHSVSHRHVRKLFHVSPIEYTISTHIFTVLYTSLTFIIHYRHKYIVA